MVKYDSRFVIRFGSIGRPTKGLRMVTPWTPALPFSQASAEPLLLLACTAPRRCSRWHLRGGGPSGGRRGAIGYQELGGQMASEGVVRSRREGQEGGGSHEAGKSPLQNSERITSPNKTSIIHPLPPEGIHCNVNINTNQC